MQAEAQVMFKKKEALQYEYESLEEILSVQKSDYSKLSYLSEKAIKENSILHYNLGVFYTRDGLYEEAIEEFVQVLDAYPNDSDANYNLGVIYSEFVNDEAKAAKHFKIYLQTGPRDQDSNRARKYLMLNNAKAGR